MIKFYLVALIMFIFYKINNKRKGGFSSSSLLIFIYLFSIITSLFNIYLNNQQLVLSSKYNFPAFIFVILLLLFLYPIFLFKENKIKCIILPSLKVLNVFSTIIIVLSLYSITYFIPTVNNIFSMNLGDARNSLADGGFLETSIFTTIATVSASLYVFAIMLFFIYQAIGKNKIRSMLLFISSFSFVLNVLSFAGRDGVVFWIFSFLFCYIIFKNYLPVELKNKIIKLLGLLIIPLLLVPFLLITKGRFEEDYIYSIVEYLGQGFPNFLLYLGIKDLPHNYGNGFPLFYEIFGLNMRESFSWQEGGTVSWVFGTFLKSWISSLGFIGTIILLIFINVSFKSIFKNVNNSIQLHKFFVYILYFQVFSQGVFYFRQSNRGGNLFIVISILMYFLFSFIYKNTNNNNHIVLTKKNL